MHAYYAQQNGKVYYTITSQSAVENDATLKYPNIS